MTCRNCWKCEYTTLSDGMQQHCCTLTGELATLFKPACKDGEEKQCTLCKYEKDYQQEETENNDRCELCLALADKPYFERSVLEDE